MPTYPHQCPGCECKFDVFTCIQARNAKVKCPKCGTWAKRNWSYKFGFSPFREGFYSIGEEGEYITSRKQLKEVCNREGLISHYLEIGRASCRERV